MQWCQFQFLGATNGFWVAAGVSYYRVLDIVLFDYIYVANCPEHPLERKGGINLIN